MFHANHITKVHILCISLLHPTRLQPPAAPPSAAPTPTLLLPLNTPFCAPTAQTVPLMKSLFTQNGNDLMFEINRKNSNHSRLVDCGHRNSDIKIEQENLCWENFSVFSDCTHTGQHHGWRACENQWAAILRRQRPFTTAKRGHVTAEKTAWALLLVGGGRRELTVFTAASLGLTKTCCSTAFKSHIMNRC